MTTKQALTRSAATSRARDVGFRPRGMTHYTPKYSIEKGDLFAEEARYGHLDDSTSYAEYAWEFLRRNSFYQRMIDNTAPQHIELWGYLPSPGHLPHFGVCRPIPYRNKYSTSIRWEPIEQSRLLIREAIMKTAGLGPANQPIIEVKGPQTALVIDLSEQFGPDCIGLRHQLEIAVEELASWMTKKQLKEEHIKPSKRTLRTYLQMADCLTYPQRLWAESIKGYGPAHLITVDQAAEHLLFEAVTFRLLSEKLREAEFKRRQDRAYRYAKQAWDYIYKWKCLNLLTYPDKAA